MTSINQLTSAVRDNDIKTVEWLLDQGVAVNAKDNFGCTPIDYVGNNIEMLKLLLTRGAHPNNAERLFGCTLLHNSNDNAEIVEVLLAHGASPHAVNQAGNTPLHCTISNAESVNQLLAYSASLHTKNKEGRTPLHCVAEKGTSSVIEVLLNHGALIQAQDHRGKTSLHAAVIGEKQAVVETLLKYGAFIQARDQDGNTPLHTAAQFSNNSLIVEMLLNRGALINLKNYSGQTPLHIAAQFATPLSVMQALLNRGSIVNRADRFDNTPLFLVDNKSRGGFAFPNDTLKRDKILLLLTHGAYIHKLSEHPLSAYWKSGFYLRENKHFYKYLLVSGVSPKLYARKRLPTYLKTIEDNIETTIKSWLNSRIPKIGLEKMSCRTMVPKVLQALPRIIYFMQRSLQINISIQQNYDLETLKSVLFVPESTYFTNVFGSKINSIMRLSVLKALVKKQLPVELILAIRERLEDWAMVDYIVKDYALDPVIANYLVFDIKMHLQNYLNLRQDFLQHDWQTPYPLPFFMQDDSTVSQIASSVELKQSNSL